MKIQWIVILFFVSSQIFSQISMLTTYDSDKAIKKADSLYNLSEFENSLEIYNTVTKTDPNYPYTISQKLYALQYLERFAEMESVFEKLELENIFPEYPELYIQKAIMLSDQERFEESETELRKAQEFMPHSYLLNFNWAILYLRMGNTQGAVDKLILNLTHNPKHESSHYILGALAMEDGRISEGCYALMAYLLLNPEGTFANQAAVLLDKNLGNEFLKKSELKFSDKDDNFIELTEILRSKIPLNKNYKLKTKIDEKFTRQVQAILEYSTSHEIGEGFFETTYLPVFKRIYEKDLTELYLLYSLQSFKTVLGKKISSETKKIESFIPALLNENFPLLFQSRKLEHFGEEKQVIIYYGDGYPSHLAEFHPDYLHGRVKVVNSHSQTLSELNFKEDKLDGVQKYYTVNVGLRQESNLVNGKKHGVERFYYPNGNLRIEQNYIEDSLSGQFNSYYIGGAKLCELTFEDNNINGIRKCYYANGNLSSRDSLINGNREGLSLNYYPNNDLKTSYTVINKKLNGEFIEYFNGVDISSYGKYNDDKPIDFVNIYYPGGALSKINEFVDGKIVRSMSYFENEEPSSETIYDEDEEIKSFTSFDMNGNKIGQDIFEEGLIKKLIQYYPDSNQQKVYDVYKNSFNLFNPITEEIKVEGKYDKGLKDGTWIHYFPNGNKKSVINYQNGKSYGTQKDFSMDQSTSYVYQVNDFTLTGSHEKYKNDKLILKKFLKEDINHGPYQYFYDGEMISYEGFILEGNDEGKKYSYRQDGSLILISKHFENEIYHTTYFNPANEVEFVLDHKILNGIVKIPRNNGAYFQEIEFNKGKMEGLYKSYDKNGRKIEELNYVNNSLFGPAQYFLPGGSIHIKTSYYNHNLDGDYLVYDMLGNMKYTTKYKFGHRISPNVFYYHNGLTRHTYATVNEYHHGESNYYNSDGMLVARIIYYYGVPHKYEVLDDNNSLGGEMPINKNAKIISNYANGKVAFELEIKNYLLENNLTIYNETGNKSYETHYSNNEINGSRIEYFSNGQIYKKENFNYGALEGIQEYFDKSGQLLLSIEYSHDELHGDFKMFKDGNIIQHKIYNSDDLVEILQ